MKILIISDTHKNFSALFDPVEKNIDNIDMLIFLGDGLEDLQVLQHVYPELEIHAVRGNCDYLPAAAEKIIKAEGFNILAVHGHKYGVKNSIDILKDYADGCGCNIALYGHSHIAKIYWGNDILVLNPGTANSKVQRGSGATYALLELEGDQILNCEIIEV